jgi:hypothetical protein
MRQLYFTSCLPGRSLYGASGFQVRAASPGLTPDRIRTAVRYAGFSLPQGADDAELLPRRLALLTTRDCGRLLCHSASAGVDPTTGRNRNYFSHLLLDIPENFRVEDAVASWLSPFWMTQDSDFATALPEPVELNPPGPICMEALRRALADPNWQAMLSFVVKALLLGERYRRIFIAAQPQDVALCIYGATKILPESMLNQLTFSTYENEPQACGARIVGTGAGHGLASDMSPRCYDNGCAGFNRFNGRRTNLGVELSFLDRAVVLLTNGEVDQLRGLSEILDGRGSPGESVSWLAFSSTPTNELLGLDLNMRAKIAIL